MASYNELLALIDAYINRNGVQAITGQILNGVLKAMVDQLGRGYTLMGYAEPTGDPGTPDGPESWFASVPGTYTNYGEIQVAAGELALLSFAPSEGWTKNTIYEGFREVTATADDNIGFPQVGVTYANGVLSFDFKNIKGEPGENGDPAGFGAVTASVDDQVGTPSVSVSSSGPDTAKNFAFAFHNLKGETGVTSVVATVDNTSGNPQCSVSLQGGQLTLAFAGLKGAQGNTGSSVDYPFTIVNNLTTNDPAQALSAAMGVELDGKVSQLEAEVTDLEDKTETTIVHTKNLADYASEINGYISSGGTFTAPSSGEKSIKFPCKPSTTYTISKVVTTRFRVAYFNNEPSPGVQGGGTITQNSASSITITTAADSAYIAAFVYNGSSESVSFEQIIASLQIEEGGTATEYVAPGWSAIDSFARGEISGLTTDVELISDAVSGVENDVANIVKDPLSLLLQTPLPSPVSGGYWILFEGVGATATKSADSGYYTWETAVNEGDVCLFYTKHSNLGSARSACLTDSDHKIVQQGWVEDGETQDAYLTPICLIAKTDGFALMNLSHAENPNVNKCAVYVYKAKREYNNQDVSVQDIVGMGNVPKIDTATGLVKLSDNPLQYLLQGLSYAGIIHDWGVIGASWDSGEFHYKKNGESSLSYEDCYEYSWGKVFARMNGVTLYNYSNGGQTTQGWIIGGSALVGENGGGGWDKAQENPKQAYIINMCGNDCTQIDRYESDPSTGYPIGDVSTDIAQDYHNNAATYVGYFAGIVQRLKELQPGAKIFIATMALSYDSTHLRVCQKAREICTYFKNIYPNDVFLLDFATYRDSWFDNTRPLLNTHGTSASYLYLGYVMNTYIDWVIRQNLSSFRDAGIIGKGTIS